MKSEIKNLSQSKVVSSRRSAAFLSTSLKFVLFECCDCFLEASCCNLKILGEIWLIAPVIGGLHPIVSAGNGHPKRVVRGLSPWFIMCFYCFWYSGESRLLTVIPVGHFGYIADARCMDIAGKGGYCFVWTTDRVPTVRISAPECSINPQLILSLKIKTKWWC